MAYSKEIIKELKEDVTPLEAVEWLLKNGYPIKVKNLGHKYVDIKCPNPEHNDRKLGNCKISTGKYDARPGSYCYCYACCKSFNSMDILKCYMNTNDSVATLAEISHQENLLHVKRRRKKQIPKKTKETLGLALYPKDRIVKSVTDIKPENCYYEQEGDHYLIMDNVKWDPWDELDDEARQYLLREKAKERMCNLGNLAIKISTHQAEPEIMEIINRYSVKEILDALNDIFCQCQKIYKKNGGKITDAHLLMKNQIDTFLDAVS